MILGQLKIEESQIICGGLLLSQQTPEKWQWTAFVSVNNAIIGSGKPMCAEQICNCGER